MSMMHNRASITLRISPAYVFYNILRRSVPRQTRNTICSFTQSLNACTHDWPKSVNGSQLSVSSVTPTCKHKNGGLRKVELRCEHELHAVCIVDTPFQLVAWVLVVDSNDERLPRAMCIRRLLVSHTHTHTQLRFVSERQNSKSHKTDLNRTKTKRIQAKSPS